ncbi:MAG: division/cell wall cluster transcriptional repressor MraZ [Chlorobi bacterium]|nr:division/cell wall cluster transcriptional repressor MraZ [Chlorobiota bacterium]
MTNFLGEYSGKIDAKGRVNFPTAFIKQMPEDALRKFVIKKDIYSKCLIIYTMEEWERQVELIKKNTNPYNRKHAEFLRQFFKGVAELKLDGNNRILIPSRLLESVEITKEVTFLGQIQKIELWAKDEYEKNEMEADDFANLTEEIIGGDFINL